VSHLLRVVGGRVRKFDTEGFLKTFNNRDASERRSEVDFEWLRCAQRLVLQNKPLEWETIRSRNSVEKMLTIVTELGHPTWHYSVHSHRNR
jgi:hypothetical protein